MKQKILGYARVSTVDQNAERQIAPFEKGTAFVVALIFGIVAALVGAIGLKIAFKDEASVKSKFYGFPIARIAVIYAVVQIIISFAFMGLAFIIPMWVELIVCFVLLIIAVIGLVATDITRDVIEKQDEKQKINTEMMMALRSKAGSLIGICNDPEARKEVQNLADEFKYSDPISSHSVQQIESELDIMLDELQKSILDNSKQDIIALCRRTKVQLAERNRLCKLNKQ